MTRRRIPSIVTSAAALAGLLACSLVAGPRSARADDCNGNGVDDAEDLQPQGLGFDLGATYGFDKPSIEALAVDLDADGDLDLAVPGYFGAGLHILINRGDGTFEDPVIYPGAQFCTGIVAADLDGDGVVDLATAGTYVYRGRGDGTFEDPAVYAGSAAASIDAGDVDGDGDMDLATAGASDQLLLLENRGGASFLEAPLPPSTTSPPQPIRLADFDGDGRLDLLALDAGAATLSTLLGDGTGAFAATLTQEAPDVAAFGSVVADVDGDGLSDVVTAGTGAIRVLLNQGDGSYGAAIETAAGSGALSIAAADLDGDGQVDLAAACYSSNEIALLLNHGQGSFPKATFLAVRPQPTSIVATDLDLDGDTDLVVLHDRDGPLTALTNDGHGVFSPLEGVPTVAGAAKVLAATLDRNDSPDLVIFSTRGPVAHLNLVVPPVGRDDNRNSILDACEVNAFHRGDSNGDGAIDISDGVKILAVSFIGLGDYGCRDAADANDDTRVDLSDAVFIFTHLFLGGAAPPRPGPPSRPCGIDARLGGGGSGSLGCERYTACF